MALHCEGARDCTLEQDDTDAAHVAEEDHRKNLSENGGGGLVYGVLAALRQNTELESSMPFEDTPSKLAASPIPLMIASSGDKTMSVIECSPTVAVGISDARDPALGHIVSATEQTSSVSDSTSPPAPETPELDGISLAVSDETRESCPTTPQNTGTLGVKSTDHAQCSHKEDLTPTVPETKMMAESPAPTSPSSSSSKSTGAVDQEKKDFKEGSKGAYLLHRMGMRKNSFTEHAATAGKDSSDSSSIKSHTSHLSAQSSQSGKNSKRSSKLLGKFVPKFLQTSTPTVSTAGFSPLSQSASLPSASTRSSRSSSMTDHCPVSVDEGMTATEAAVTVSRPSSTSASSKGSQESLPLYHTPEEEEKVEMVGSPTQISTSALDYLECLRTGSSRSPSLGRRSSCSSDASKRSENSDGPQPSDSSMTSVDSMDDGLSNSGLKIGKGINSVDVEVNEDKVEVHSFNNTDISDGKTQDGSLPMSPYVIDETCDDEFFLNSVLRKKSYASLDLEAERPRMPTSFSSNTTMGSDRSCATTPPLSGCSSSSSRASTPSPTSPMMSGHTYPFTSTFSKEMQLRSNPLPSPVNLGLDEKRRRLRDAVSEWRRSTNVSL
ncbi:hypothetical protein BGZ98_004775 [Dissophora globulifera]|nr:hypothetical protein BGZ98_004775 [Dissophora globulifera]